MWGAVLGEAKSVRAEGFRRRRGKAHARTGFGGASTGFNLAGVAAQTVRGGDGDFVRLGGFAAG